MALLTTIREWQRGGQSLGVFPHASQEFRGRRGTRSWADQHVHSVGSVLWIYLPLAASTLDGASRTETVASPSVETQRNKSRSILSMQLEIAAMPRAVPAKLIARMAYGCLRNDTDGSSKSCQE